MEAAVIVVNWNGRGFLKECLESLRNQTCKHKTFLVDNGSDDGSVVFVSELFPEVEIIKLEKNFGFAKAANVGIERASKVGYRYIALLNNDAKAEKDWLANLAAALEGNEETGIAASKMFFRDRPMVINSAGHIKKCGEIIDRGLNKTDRGQFDRKTNIFGACGGACMYRRGMLDEVGLFDEEYGSFYEDADLSWRAKKKGWKAVFVPRSVVYHKSGGTVTKDPETKKKFDELRLNNLIRLIKKNGNIIDKSLATVHWTVLVLRNSIARKLNLTKYKMEYKKRLKGIFGK